MKRPLSEIIANLEMYLEACEVGIEPPEPSRFFDDLKGELSEKVDGWIDYLEGSEVLLSHLEEKKDLFAKRAKVIRNLIDKKKAYLAHILETTNINEIKGRDHRLVLRKNSIPALHFNVPVNSSKYNHTMESFRCELPTIYPEFFSLTTFYAMDADAVKRALIAGRKIDFASIEYGQHIRII